MQIIPGQILQNRYQILSLVGRGGMGVVYQAYDLALQRTVAVKVLPSQLTTDDEFVARFKREAVLSANLRHPNIVTVHDVGQEGTEYYIIMEYLEGTTLEQALENGGPMSLVQTSGIVRQVADALDHAHGRGMVHRDVKPSNIMLDTQNRAVLMDFGLVRAGEGLGPTRQSMVIGTPEYMAPEQVLGKAIDRRTDIYAFGVVIYQMLTGRTPFAHTTPVATAHAHAYEPPPPLRTVNKAIPKSTEAVVMKALVKDPAGRYQSAGHLARDFSQSINGTMPAGLTALPSVAVAAAQRGSRKQSPSDAKRQQTTVMPGPQGAPSTAVLGTNKPNARAYLIGGALLAIGVLVVVILWMRKPPPVSPPLSPSAPATVLVAVVQTGTPTLRPVAEVASDTPTLRPVAETASDTPTPAMTPTAIDTATPTVAPTQPPSRSPTATIVPTDTATSTDTPTATKTATPTFTSTRSSTKTPTSTSRRPTATPTTPMRAVPALGSPAQGAVLTESATFSWQWAGPPLTPNQAFEVRLWKEGQSDHFGAADPVRVTSLTLDLATAYAVQQGGSGPYLWTVAVVQIDPYQRIGEEAPPHSVTVEVSSGGGGGGGGADATPTPP